jgi:hypothetical protein
MGVVNSSDQLSSMRLRKRLRLLFALEGWKQKQQIITMFNRATPKAAAQLIPKRIPYLSKKFRRA